MSTQLVDETINFSTCRKTLRQCQVAKKQTSLNSSEWLPSTWRITAPQDGEFLSLALICNVCQSIWHYVHILSCPQARTFSAASLCRISGSTTQRLELIRLNRKILTVFIIKIGLTQAPQLLYIHMIHSEKENFNKSFWY